MKRRPQTAIDDGKSPHTEAAVLAARLGETLSLEVDAFFREYGITLRQFNILRILYVRDHERKGLSRGTLEARLLHRVPDVTRLLDRLEGAGLIERHRPPDDQRTVLSTLTAAGWMLVEKSHQPLLKLNRKQFAHFTAAELAQLIKLQHKALTRPEGASAAAE